MARIYYKPVGYDENEFRTVLKLLEKYRNDEVIGRLLLLFDDKLYDYRILEHRTLDIFENGILGRLLFSKVIVLGKLIHHNLFEIYCRDKTIRVHRRMDGIIECEHVTGDSL